MTNDPLLPQNNSEPASPFNQNSPQSQPASNSQPISPPPPSNPFPNNSSSTAQPPSTETTPPFPISVNNPKPAKPTFSNSNPPPPPPPSDKPKSEAGEPAELVEPALKRFLPIIIVLIITIFLSFLIKSFILPRFKKAKTPETVSLKYWGLWEPENVMVKIINDYRQTHPEISIQYIRQSPKDYRERLQSALAKGTGPDIFRWHNTWLPMLKNDLAPVPEDIYSSGDFNTFFYPIVKKDVFSGGSYYGIPLEFDALVLYINQDIFQAQPDLKIPTTWDNLRQTAFKLKQTDARGSLTRGGIAMGTTANVDNFSDIFGLMILQNGGDPGQPDNQAVTSALKFYTLFSSQDKSWNDKLPSSTYAFATQKVAMIIAPSWRALEVKQINPQLNFKLYPVPQLPGTNIAWASYWIEGVSKTSSSQQQAFEFLKYLSSPKVLTKMYNLASQTRLFGEPYSRVDMASSLQQDPFVGAVITQAISAQSWPLASQTFDNGLNDKIIKYYQDAVNSLNKSIAEKKVLDNLSSGVSQVLRQYGLVAKP